ncbi:MAG: nucleotide exchange factor GrpE [Myxococcales bacterium]|nr:nucleotide exchange factor GrpE [Myxococcales bacterium]
MSNEDPVQDEAAQPDAPEGAAPSDVTEAPADAAGDAGPEAVAEPPAEAAPEAPPEKTLEEKLEESKAATAAMKEKMLRVAADFENYRRRSTREVDDARKRGVQHAVRELLPVFDNLERATTHIGPEADAKSMADGLRMVLKQFIDVIAKVGVERVEAVGSPFDPNVHE